MKMSLEMYENFFNSLKMGITIVDRNDVIIAVNRLFGEMVQKDPRQLVGNSVFLCHPEESRPAVQKLIDEFKKGTKTPYETWLNFRGRILREQIYPIISEEGKYSGMVDMLGDAADIAGYLKRLGEWKEIPVKGLKK